MKKKRPEICGWASFRGNKGGPWLERGESRRGEKKAKKQTTAPKQKRKSGVRRGGVKTHLKSKTVLFK